MGLTTQFLFETLGPFLFVDTLFLVNTLEPDKYDLRRVAKTGPKKAPDYVGFSPGRRPLVLECKGTQSSHRALEDAIRRGRSQKQSLSGSVFSYSLCAGLFIPQARSSEEARIHVVDPGWPDLEALFKKFKGAHRPLLMHGAMQVSLAKHFALAGLPITATYLGKTPMASLDRIPVTVRREIKSWQNAAIAVRGRYRLSFELPPLAASDGVVGGERYTMRRASISD